LYGINSYNVRGLRHLPYSSLHSLSLGFTKDTDATSSSLKFGLSCLPSRRGFRVKLYGHVDVGILEVLQDGTIMVTDLTLEIDTSLTRDNMKCIRELRWVRTLRRHFDKRQEGDKLEFDANRDDFPRLEVLEITSLDRDTPLHVEFAPGLGAVGTLKVLKFVGSLKIAPGGLHVLPSLKEVWVEGRSLRRAMGEVLEGHPTKPAVIHFSSWQYTRDPENVEPELIE